MRVSRLTAAMAAACVAAGCVALAGCGGREPVVPQGNPDARHGAETVDVYASIELMRSLLIAASDGFALGGSAEEAQTQLARARALYDPLSPRVRATDPILDREVLIRFDQTARELRQGAPPDRFRGLVGALFDQLADGITQAAVPTPARTDPGVQAEALRRITLRLAATYDAARSTSSGDPASRLAFQESWGLWRRASVLDGVLGGRLGHQQDRIAGDLNNLRASAFPAGPVPQGASMQAKVDAAARRVAQSLDARFGLQAL